MDRSKMKNMLTCQYQWFEPHQRPQPAKLPSFGGYSLETLPYLTLHVSINVVACLRRENTQSFVLMPAK